METGSKWAASMRTSRVSASTSLRAPPKTPARTRAREPSPSGESAMTRSSGSRVRVTSSRK